MKLNNRNSISMKYSFVNIFISPLTRKKDRENSNELRPAATNPNTPSPDTTPIKTEPPLPVPPYEKDNTIATLNIREYWVMKFNISFSASLSLNWTSFGRAFKAIGFSRQICMRKWLSQTVPIGATLRKRKSGTDNRCPRCNSYDETTQHVLTCANKEVKIHRAAPLTALFTTVRDMDTCPLLTEALELVVSRWLRSPLRFRLDSC